MKTLTTKRQKAKWLKQIESCLMTYYRLPERKINTWRFNKSLENAKHRINNDIDFKENRKILLKGAQWGGKWGNYYRMIALNSKNEYQYVEGFNPLKNLS